MLRCKSKVGVGLLMVALISCSIVKDSDITSLAQLNALSLKSFEIVQNSQAGNSSSLAVFKYDSVVNRISSGTGAHVSRVLGFSLPALGNYKMTLKSKATAATEIAIGYRDNGMPNAVTISQGATRVEWYRFFYNSKDQLIQLITDLNPDTGQPFSLHTRDSIIYTGSAAYPSSIIRNSPDATLAGTFNMQTNCQNCGGSAIDPITFNRSSQQVYQLNFYTGGNCSNDYYIYSCGGVTKSSGSGGGQNGNQPQLSFLNNFTFNKTIQTALTSASPTDIYYFHPIMILKDVVPQGDFYFWFYSNDWFAGSTNTSNNNDMVKINFNYGK